MCASGGVGAQALGSRSPTLSHAAYAARMAPALAIPTVADLPAMYRIAMLAEEDGSATGPAALPEDPDLIGHVYAGPYVIADPSACRVLLHRSRAVGFCVATPDSRAFEDWCESHWWPALRSRHALPRDGERSADASLIRLIHRPERTSDQLQADFPAHLHINLLPEAQGAGGGGRLIRAIHAELAGRGVPGVHLGVRATNVRAIGFYEHLGYRLLGDEEGGTGRLYGFTLA